MTWTKPCEECGAKITRRWPNGRFISDRVWANRNYCSIMCGNKTRKNRKKIAPKLGTKNPAAKLTEEQVRAIRKDDRPGKIAAVEYGISATTFYRIKTRDLWKHLD